MSGYCRSTMSFIDPPPSSFTVTGDMVERALKAGIINESEANNPYFGNRLVSTSGTAYSVDDTVLLRIWNWDTHGSDFAPIDTRLKTLKTAKRPPDVSIGAIHWLSDEEMDTMFRELLE